MKSTKKAFLMSVMSMLLCVAMFVGTTFSWFTDRVESGTNKIVAGNLDVELYHTNASVAGEKVDGSTKLFTDVSLWEPGAAAFETLTVKNVGTLALNYQLNVLIGNETKINGHGLSEVLKIGSFAGTVADGAEREDVLASITDWADLASFGVSGSLDAGTDTDPVTYVITWQSSDGDDLFNMNNENQGEELSIEFGINLIAGQKTKESDSFDDQYDYSAFVQVNPLNFEEILANLKGGENLYLAAGKYTVSANEVLRIEKDGVKIVGAGIDKTVIDAGTYTVSGQAGLLITADNVTVANLTVKSAPAIDATAKNTSPIKVTDLLGTDGDHMIENVKIENVALEGFKGHGLNIHGVTNAVIDNVEIRSFGKCAIAFAKATATVTNTKTVEGGWGADIACMYANNDSYNTPCSITVGEGNKFDNGFIYSERPGSATQDTITGLVDPWAKTEAADGTFVYQDTYKLIHWSGRLDEARLAKNTNTAAKTVVIGSADQFAAFAKAVNTGTTYEGYTVTLTTDVDLENKPWTPIGGNTMGSYPGVTFIGTFDGQNHTVSNLKTSSSEPSYACAGLFGTITGTVKNLNITDVDITSTHYAGAVVAYASDCGQILNCHVSGGTITSVPEWTGTEYDNGDKVGGINGYGAARIDGCSVENLTVTGYRDIGGIAGAIGNSEGTVITVSNNTVTNVTLVQDNTNGYKSTKPTTVGAIVGRDLTVTLTNNTDTDVTFKVISNESKLTDALAAAQPGDTVTLASDVAYEKITLPETLTDITIKGVPGTTVSSISIVPKDDGAQTIDNLVVENVNLTTTGGSVVSIVPQAGDSIGKITLKDCNIAIGGTKYTDKGIDMGNVAIDSPDTELVFDGCVFTANSYALYNSASTKVKSITFTNCTFTDLSSWALMINNSLNAEKFVVSDCKFVDYNGGLVKFQGTSAIDEFVFSNNEITNCKGHDSLDAKWFTVNVTCKTLDVSGNKIRANSEAAWEEFVVNADKGFKATVVAD